jgi:hypothetical protein
MPVMNPAQLCKGMLEIASRNDGTSKWRRTREFRHLLETSEITTIISSFSLD